MEPKSPGLPLKRANLRGWLKKPGGLMRQWNSRWFVLNDSCLFYFNNEDDKNPAGTILLSNQRITVPSANPTESDKFLFEISESPSGTATKGENSHPLLLCAATDEERQMWVKALRRALYADKGGAIFGQALEETMKYEHSVNREIPFIIEQCVEFLYANGLDTDGLFRQGGRVALLRDLTEKFDSAIRMDLQKSDVDVHTVASLLKQYLRDLPDSLIPCRFYQRFMSAAMTSQCARTAEEKLKQVEVLRDLMPDLPDDNYRILKYLCRFLVMVGEHAQQNRMDFRNLGLILGYNLIRHIDSNPQIFAATTDLSQELLCMMLEHFDTVFSHDPAQRRIHNVPVDDLLRVSTINPGIPLLQPLTAASRQNTQDPTPGVNAGGLQSENLKLLAELDLSGSDQRHEEEIQRRGRPNPARRSATLPSQSKMNIPSRPAPKPPATATAAGRDGGTQKSPPPLRPTPVPPARRSRPHRRHQVRSEDLTPLSPTSPTSTSSSSGSVSSLIFPVGEKDDISSDSRSSFATASDKMAAKSSADELPGLASRQALRQASGESSEPVANGGDHPRVDGSGKVLPSHTQKDLQIEALKDELQRTRNTYDKQVSAMKAQLVTMSQENEKKKQEMERRHKAEVEGLKTKLAAMDRAREEAVDRVMLVQSQLQRYQLKYGELKGD